MCKDDSLKEKERESGLFSQFCSMPSGPEENKRQEVPLGTCLLQIKIMISQLW